MNHLIFGEIVRIVAAVFCVGLPVLISGCGGGGENHLSSPTPTPTPSPTVSARAFYDSAANHFVSYRVLIEWNAPANVPDSEILEYQIMREGEIVAVVPAGATRYTDIATFVPPVTYRLPSADGTALVTFARDVTPLNYGSPYRYQINFLRARQIGDVTRYAIVSQGPIAGPVTPLLPPARQYLVSNRSNKLTFDLSTVAGADQYVLEFSTTEDFAQKVVRGPFSLPLNSSAEYEVDLSREYGAEPEGARGFFRFGARSGADIPGPISDGIQTPNGGNYIYSAADGFIINNKPPAPPM